MERLIEEGLERYAKNDLDGALMSWEGALALAPEEPRALGYVDYVRAHYELLKGAGGAATASELSVPFGLASLGDDDPYDIEVSETGERARVEAFIEGVDDGWFIDDGLALPTVARPLPLPAEDPRSSPAITLELDADEPPLGLEALDFGPSGTQSRSTFDDDKTRDFASASRLANPLDPGFAAIGDLELELGDSERAKTAPLERVTLSGPAPGPRPGPITTPPATASGDFDFDSTADETAELKDRHMGFVRAAADRPPGPGAWAAPEPATADLKVRFRPQMLQPVLAPSLEPAVGDAIADIDLPEPPSKADLRNTATIDLPKTPTGELVKPPRPARLTPVSRPATAPVQVAVDRPAAATLDLPAPPGGLDLDAPADDERTIERNAWARARPPTPSGAALELDLDLGGSSSIAPPVITEEPLHEPVRRAAPTRELAQGTGRPGAPAGRSTRPRMSSPTPATAPPAAPSIVPFRATAAPTLPPTHALLTESDRAAPPDEPADDRVRRRIGALVDRAAAATKEGRHRDAVIAVDLALTIEPDSAVAQKLVHRSRDQIMGAYTGFLGDLQARPALAVPMHEVARQPLDTRAAFLLSRVDGTLTLDELLDVSGMPRLEALRHLANLVALGILALQ
ncbi:MAG: hypothetical protein K8W52_22510 [Deltaproteobacteria bacterium]|nr:hypothetical protein [Deltaproteobacteria bacterium]